MVDHLTVLANDTKMRFAYRLTQGEVHLFEVSRTCSFHISGTRQLTFANG